ncbi:MAG: type II toxin-antitoxin system VapC family toxin [Chloroflexi bacterium]|nr:type II toxin-antitoxin system VapC family toxin [Chloroflexota bacterium]
MTPLYILDTDHITLLQRNQPAIIGRIMTIPPEQIAVTIVSAMEQVRGRLAQINRAKTASQVVAAFARFQEALDFYRTVSVLPYDDAAAAQFNQLRQYHKNRPGTQDLRIASIVLSQSATLVMRNQKDFEMISGLQLQDWSLAAN